jgi:dsRNA-specific ribonuclease
MGDAVLDFIVVEWLLEKYPKDDPGNLTFRKSSVV